MPFLEIVCLCSGQCREVGAMTGRAVADSQSSLVAAVVVIGLLGS